MKPTGYLVMERCDDWEQALAVHNGAEFPSGGILDWATDKNPRAMFSDRASAKAAITRTEHYRLAFGRSNLPEKRFCSVVPVISIKTPQIPA